MTCEVQPFIAVVVAAVVVFMWVVYEAKWAVRKGPGHVGRDVPVGETAFIGLLTYILYVAWNNQLIVYSLLF